MSKAFLAAALAARVDMPFSCAMGGCGACRARSTEVGVAMQEPNCLSRAERERGYVLTCVAYPRCATAIEVEGA